MGKKKDFSMIKSDVASFISMPETETEPATEPVHTDNNVYDFESKTQKAQNAKKKYKDRDGVTRMSLYFPTELLERVTMLARASNMSRNKFMIELMNNGLKDEKYADVIKKMESIMQMLSK